MSPAINDGMADRMAELQNYRTTELQNYRTTELQNYRTTELQNYRTTELQNSVPQLFVCTFVHRSFLIRSATFTPYKSLNHNNRPLAFPQL